MASEGWTHNEPVYHDSDLLWVCVIEDDAGFWVCDVEKPTREKCLHVADLICAAPGQAEQIDELEHTVREVLGGLEQAYNGRHDNVRRNMWQRMDEKFSRIIIAIRELREVLTDD